MVRHGLLVGWLLLVLVACGGSDTGSTAASAGDDGAAEVTTTVTPPPEATPPGQTVSTTTPASADSTITQPAAGGPSETLLAIQTRGVVNVGVRVESLFGDPIGWAPFEHDLAAAVAEALIPGVEVAYLDVTNTQRFLYVATGDTDFGLGLTSHRTSRESDAAFSQPYLLNGSVALVSADSGIVSIADLDGRTIALSGNPSTVTRVEDALARAGVTATLKTFESGSQVPDAVVSGDADAGVLDWIGAPDWLAFGEGELSIVPIDLLHNPVAIYTSVGDPSFAVEVSAALQKVIDDGTWLSLFEKYFGAPPPWTIEEMLAVPPDDR